MWTCEVCVWVNEGQLVLTGVLGTGKFGSLRQEAPVTSAGIPRLGAALVGSPQHFVEGSSRGQECSHTSTQIGLGHHPGCVQGATSQS